MPSPSAILTKSFIDVAVMSDVYERSDDLADQILDIILGLEDVEVSGIVPAFAHTLRVMSDDLLTWRALGDLAVRLDLHGVLPTLREGLERNPDVHQLANALTLSTSPFSDAIERRAVLRFLDSHQSGRAPVRMLGIRAGTIAPETDLEILLHAQCWPGDASPNSRRSVAPVVYVANSRPNVSSPWHCAAAIAQMGGRVRWVEAGEVEPAQAWAAADFPFVHWSGTELASWRRVTGRVGRLNSLLAPEDLSDDISLKRLMGKVESALPTGSRFLRGPRKKDELPAIFSPQVLEEGAFDVPEMAFLGASSRSSLQRFAKEGLAPANADVQRWRFNQLIAVRLVAGFRSRGLRYQKSTAELVGKLSEIATANATQRVGIGTDGALYLDDGNGFRNMGNEQQALSDVLAFDDAFRPFDLGNGRIPDLLRPSRHTVVHPSTLGGTPCIEDRRISARALALAVHGAGDSDFVLRSTYPELSAAELHDGARLGEAILSVAA